MINIALFTGAIFVCASICVQCYVECEWHLHRYLQGKFGYLYPLLGVQRGCRELQRLEERNALPTYDC